MPASDYALPDWKRLLRLPVVQVCSGCFFRGRGVWPLTENHHYFLCCYCFDHFSSSSSRKRPPFINMADEGSGGASLDEGSLDAMLQRLEVAAGGGGEDAEAAHEVGGGKESQLNRGAAGIVPSRPSRGIKQRSSRHRRRLRHSTDHQHRL